MKDRIKKVMANIFGIDGNLINNNSSPDNIDNWDSLKHMSLIVALEEEFETEFSDDEIFNTMSYSLIVDVLETNKL
jgi:acyl carrier protein